MRPQRGNIPHLEPEYYSVTASLVGWVVDICDTKYKPRPLRKCASLKVNPDKWIDASHLGIDSDRESLSPATIHEQI